jgi:hypothetical protein
VPALVLGPVLRHTGPTDATVWVETDRPCEVEVLGCTDRTFEVAGHHYGLVHVTGLEPGSATEYGVRLDGADVWPEPGSPFGPSSIRTPGGDEPIELHFGSCRVQYPHEEPWTLTKDQDPRGREIDALRLVALRMAKTPPDRRPHGMILLGDQIYADEVAPATCEWIRERRDPEVPPGETLADFEEFTRLYRESWGDPPIRWLLSTVPSAMVFDDHDVHDDWNTSQAWVDAIRARGWWDDRITGAFMSYWIYQHLGNLSPADLESDEWYAAVREPGDAADRLRQFAWRADRAVDTAQWSYRRDIGPVRLVMVDSRAGRILEPGGRSMVDAPEWEFVERSMAEPHRHLLIGTSLPWLLEPGLHWLEAWNEAVCDGAWGARWAHVGEQIRQGLDLEHWAAFQTSFVALSRLVESVAAGRFGDPPATVISLSGDVHHSYLTEIGFRRGSGVRSRVWQAVCSPFRNPLGRGERRAVRMATSRPAWALARALGRAAGVADPPVRWRTVHDEVFFHNMVGTLRFDGEAARLVLESEEEGELCTVYERDL